MSLGFIFKHTMGHGGGGAEEEEEFTPTGSPVGWWKADAITGLEDGDPVGTWVDNQNSYQLTQSDNTKKPTYKTGIQNSLPVVRFAGDEVISAYQVGTSYTTGTWTWQVVVDVSGGARENIISGLSGAPNDDDPYKQIMLEPHYGYNPNRDYVYSGDGTNYDSVRKDENIASGIQVVSWDRNGATVRNWRNGTLKVNGSITNYVGTYDGWKVGNRIDAGSMTTYGLAGDIAEIIIYNTNLSDADRQVNESGLGTKWDITVN